MEEGRLSPSSCLDVQQSKCGNVNPPFNTQCLSALLFHIICYHADEVARIHWRWLYEFHTSGCPSRLCCGIIMSNLFGHALTFVLFFSSGNSHSYWKVHYSYTRFTFECLLLRSHGGLLSLTQLYKPRGSFFYVALSLCLKNLLSLRKSKVLRLIIENVEGECITIPHCSTKSEE